jgi:hypothetical protein
MTPTPLAELVRRERPANLLLRTADGEVGMLRRFALAPKVVSVGGWDPMTERRPPVEVDAPWPPDTLIVEADPNGFVDWHRRTSVRELDAIARTAENGLLARVRAWTPAVVPNFVDGPMTSGKVAAAAWAYLGNPQMPQSARFMNAIRRALDAAIEAGTVERRKARDVAARVVGASSVEWVYALPGGLAADLLARLDDGAEFADAVNNAAIDTIGLGDPEAMVEAFAAVAALNATGDAAAYWQVR